ncbi:MAG TPA: flagellin lysine-N-methylase [Terracidiphilus sp.]|nr:flagellin lysine-N-methylase [Terracidiphilus sp.]
MPQEDKHRPLYGRAFRCIGAECEETCCHGMSVLLDRRTYEKYQAFPQGELRILAQQYVARNMENPTETLYGRIDLTPSHDCPFFSADRLCKIQNELGVEALSPTCSIYPRALNQVQGEIEVSLHLSCPEAARQVLLDPEFSTRVAGQDASWFHTDRFSRLAANGEGLIHKPYAYFQEVRQSVVTLLRDRARPLWQRMFLLGTLCQQLNEIAAPEQDAAVPAVLAHYAEIVATQDLKQELENLDSQPEAQLNAVLQLSDLRLRAGAVEGRFRECVMEALAGLGDAPDVPAPDYSRHYLHAQRQYFLPLMEQRPYLLENYLLNYVYRTLFPFGREASAHIAPLDIYSEYLLLAAQFSIVQGLLIALAGHYREQFGVEHVVKLVQSVSKALEHNPTFLAQIGDFLRTQNLASPQGIVTLLKLP